MELINQIFAKENVNSGRQMEIDLAKVVFVLMVAAVHITIDCVPEEALSTGADVCDGSLSCLQQETGVEGYFPQRNFYFHSWICLKSMPVYDTGSDRVRNFRRYRKVPRPDPVPDL